MGTPQERLEQLAQATRQQWETGSEVIAIYTGAAAAAELADALRGRRQGLETFAKSVELDAWELLTLSQRQILTNLI